MLHIKFCLIDQAVSEIFEIVDGRTADGRTKTVASEDIDKNGMFMSYTLIHQRETHFILPLFF